jgi:hypothetical protein
MPADPHWSVGRRTPADRRLDATHQRMVDPRRDGRRRMVDHHPVATR